jgi:lysophospholipase L1-like esterase
VNTTALAGVPNANATTVAFLGSSSTAGKGQAFDWIAELKRRPVNKRFRFHNFGAGGDLAFNALQRLPNVLACRPRIVVVWVGGNDVLALVSTKVRRFSRVFKHVPIEPSPQWFRENLRAILTRVKAAETFKVALCSLLPIGEDLESENSFQSDLNLRIKEYSAIIKEVSKEHGASYIPLYEAMCKQIMASSGRAFTCFRYLPFYRDAFRALVLRKSPDEISLLNGWRFHSDGVHLNGRGGLIVADLMQAFIDEN